MLDHEFNEQRAKLLRELAEQADPFVKRRLLKLVERYQPKGRAAPVHEFTLSLGDAADRKQAPPPDPGVPPSTISRTRVSSD
ncbi:MULTISPECIES: hypothetical protein [unclassified Bradyrhizobium]|uniref:hypothetical protein n=1 Tax=unclassified Bradyrhizobium TaxID=2631580 RepID=UPI001CD7C59F|nr:MULTISPECIES: hypothetical protein [unclassified Bradyrhizobium]MCA1386055.1 hypothetical protein [Bradyrhizobium sp. BRP05]MCA1393853.1 hypothetical protein [Bradyrhizobium sp. IC3123]MCA1423497.1 hypothetical protein [Bradyrhizobium sp. BRP23]MCA1430609.1 hypothetical protein [Bradyrhizobium sp. NBAIM16]MCA1480120.1 hypothetical protein [Bradyrhizobium sp. NBAIM08]